MYHQSSQHFDLEQDDVTSGFGGADPNSWLSGDVHRPSSPSHRRNLSAFSNSTSTTAAGNVDRDLFNDLVQIVPLVQSLIDRKANSSFTRRGSMIYTKTPSRESLSKKMTEAKGRNAQSIPGKKRRENGGNDQDGGADGFSMFSSSAILTKDKEELAELREKVEDLQRQLLEKDEILKSAEASKNEMTSVQRMLDEVKKQASEKDALLRSTQAQLADVKIKLADKQAAVEKLQWEATTSNRKAEKLQEDLNTIQGEISSYTVLFEGLSNDNITLSDQEYDVTPYGGHLPEPDTDEMDELDMSKMEEAQEAYMAAVAAAKEKQDEESIGIAASARLHLQSLVLRS